MAKIYDPVFFEDEETWYDDPFVLRDFTLSCEVEAYRRLEPLQGTEVPRFYGYFTAALPSQDDRTVNIILLEEVPGRDLRAVVPPAVAENVCAKHMGAIIDAALYLFLDILAWGVKQRDMQPRNVILRPQKHMSLLVSGVSRFCDTKECVLALEVDCDELDLVMVDFEIVDFKEQDTSIRERSVQREEIQKVKSMYLVSILGYTERNKYARNQGTTRPFFSSTPATVFSSWILIGIFACIHSRVCVAWSA